PGAVRQPRLPAHRLRGPNACGPPRLAPTGPRPGRAGQDGSQPRRVALLLLRRPGGPPDRGVLAHPCRLPAVPRGPHQPDTLRGGPTEASVGTGSGSGHSDYGRRRGTGTVVIEDADPNSRSGRREDKMPVTPCAPALSVRRSDRPAHPVGGVLAQVRGHSRAENRL